MVWVKLMDGQCLTRHCLTLPFLLLHLAGMLSLITMCCLHVGFHGTHASCCETIRATGQAHLIMFADMVIKGSLFVDQNTHKGQKFASTQPLTSCIFARLRASLE